MMYRAIIFPIEGGRELEWKFGDDQRFNAIFEAMLKALAAPEPEIVYDGEFDLESILQILISKKGFTTYIMFRSYAYSKLSDQESLIQTLRQDAELANYPEFIDKTMSGQLIRMYNLRPQDAIRSK